MNIPTWVLWAVGALTIAAAGISYGPTLLASILSKRTSPVPNSTPETAHKLVSEIIDVECPHEATFLAVKRAFDHGDYEVCRKLLEAAIEQKGPLNG
jgi:hypothetical protein